MAPARRAVNCTADCALRTADQGTPSSAFTASQPGRKAADSEKRIRPTTNCLRTPSGRRADSLFRIRWLYGPVGSLSWPVDQSVSRWSAVVSWQCAVRSGQWAVGSGQWAVGSGQCAVRSAQWAVGSGFGAKKSPRDSGAFGGLNPAVTYVPTRLPVQYHRRWRA